MNRYVMYTAILGPAGDDLRALPFAPSGSGVAAFAFVDDQNRARLRLAGSSFRGWRILDPVFPPDGSYRRQARKHKILSHELFPDCEASLWIDGCLCPRLDPSGLIEATIADGVDLGTFRHGERCCVYEEAEACIKLKKDAANVIQSQMSRYRADGYPSGMGLAETTAVIRRHSNQIRVFNYQWWSELVKGSLRDQLSFDVVCWRLGIRYRHIEGTRTSSDYFRWFPHASRRPGPRRRPRPLR